MIVIYDRKTFIVQATGWNGFPGRKVLAYLSSLSTVTKQERFVTSTAGRLWQPDLQQPRRQQDHPDHPDSGFKRGHA